MRIPPPLVAATVVLIAVASACSSTDTRVAPTTTSGVAPTTTAAPTTTQLEVVTTVRRVPSAELVSQGHITVGTLRYDFAFECYHAGAGDILALGVGEDPNGDSITQAIVQAFLGQTYVAVLVGETQVVELAIDQPAELFVQSNMIRGSALRFVDAAGSAGVGEDLGLGAVTVSCQGFAPGLPDEYVIS